MAEQSDASPALAERSPPPPGPAEDSSAVSRDPGTPDTASDDANGMRAFFFNQRMRRRSTWIWGGILSLIFGIGAALITPALSVAGIGVGVLVTMLIVLAMADSASEKAFFRAYAKQRGMELIEKGELPPVTPLLRKGDERKAKDICRGPLAGGVDGYLALYTYTEVHYDKDGRHETDYNYTVGICDVPECAELLPELYANRKSGFRFLEKVEDAFRNKVRVKLESEKLDQEYEIFADPKQDQNWLRQLFSPTFIVWMTDSAPPKFAFEFDNTVLVCNVKGHKQSAAELDAMRAATAAVARRLRDEAREDSSNAE